jgi:hypothetical protein
VLQSTPRLIDRIKRQQKEYTYRFEPAGPTFQIQMLYGQWLMNLTVFAVAALATCAPQTARVAVFMARKTSEEMMARKLRF